MINHLLVTHLLAATVWTGGHVILATAILPRVLKVKDINGLMKFEQSFEKIGMPALFIQIITGVWMAYAMYPSVPAWFSLENDISVLISLKLTLLTATALIALHARFRVIPNLTEHNLKFFAWHIIAITILSIGFVIVGSLFRTGL